MNSFNVVIHAQFYTLAQNCNLLNTDSRMQEIGMCEDILNTITDITDIKV